VKQEAEKKEKTEQEFLELSTPQSIYHWFDGRNLPTIDNLYALSELFHMPIDDFLIGNRKYEYRCQSNMYQRVLAYFDRIVELKAG
jgi:transcriptional regulator with XRE-family HTH domain